MPGKVTAYVEVSGLAAKSRIESLLPGSVSRRVAAFAPCTVTIVK